MVLYTVKVRLTGVPFPYVADIYVFLSQMFEDAFKFDIDYCRVVS